MHIEGSDRRGLGGNFNPPLRSKYLWLPFLGAVAAVLAFRLAAPYEGTLDRNLPVTDPQALFTYGTPWGAVNRVAFGALICGGFTLALNLGRRSWFRVLLAAIFAAAVGGFVNYWTDSSSDILGIAISRMVPLLGSIVAMIAWCLVVPFGIAFTIFLATGMTRQRMKRVWFISWTSAIGAFAAQQVGGLFAPHHSIFQTFVNGETINLSPFVPAWQAAEIGAGIVLGFMIAFADEIVRKGTIRLILAHNEFRDWSLDYSTNRIGAAEGCQIPLFGRQGIEPVHALVVRQGNAFFLQPQAPCLLNGSPATQVMLNSGDTIQIGDAQLVFFAAGWAKRAPQAAMVRPATEQARAVSGVSTLQGPSGGSVHVLVDAVGAPVRLVPGRYVVGRDEGAAIRLTNDATVSRRHAEVVVTPVGVEVVELGSTNGTRVNGAALSGVAQLRPGDVVEFGATRFTLQQ
jgi:hypothetical protein